MKYKMQMFLTVLVLQFFNTTAHAKYVDAKVVMKGGDVIECSIKLPIQAQAKKVKIKREPHAKAESISCDQIDMIRLTSNDVSAWLKRTKVEFMKTQVTKLSKVKVWLEVHRYCENIMSFRGVSGYDVDKNGNLLALVHYSMGEHFLQRTGELNPVGVGYVFAGKPIARKGFDKQRRTKLLRYFSNDAEAMRYFESKERITESEIIEFIDSICIEINNE